MLNTDVDSECLCGVEGINNINIPRDYLQGLLY